MSASRIQLTINDILDKEFKKSMRGYNEEDVDAFLDIVIKDYENLHQEIAKLREENERFKRSTNQTQSRTAAYHSPPQANYDVLKRLSNLEKAVFGSKLSEKEG